MTQGFKATLFAGVITLGVVAPVFAAAPVITEIPDVTIGDLESATNTFEYDAPFNLNDYVSYDGNKQDLLWSFGESDNDGLGTQQYTINGVGSAITGQAALDAEEVTRTVTVNPAEPIPTTGTTTLFRDIILSPAEDAGPYPDPSGEDAALAAAGKLVTYYVSDGTDVDSAQAIIRSVDGANDSISASEGWVERVDDSDFSSTNWVSSGLASEGVTNAKQNGALTVTLTPTSGKSRVYGWVNNSLMPYDEVGPDRFVRGKFYVSTTNFVLNPTNEVPGFRLRVTNAGSINAAAHFEYSQTNLASPAHEPRYAAAANPDAELNAGWFIRPGDRADVPSLYRVNLDTVDVPAAAGSQIGALFEAYSFSDSANGTLSLHEVILGTYDALEDADGTEIFNYNRNLGLANGAGGPKQMTGGPFNMEANFEDGRRQKLYVPEAGDPGPYATNTDNGANGIVASTAQVPTTLFGINLMNVVSVNNQDKVRIEPNTLYKAKFYATSSMPATGAGPVQGNVRFRFQTAGTTLSYLMEVTSTAGPALSEDGVADAITAQAIPSIGSQNPDTDSSLAFAGEGGGWYNVVVSSPTSPDGIRQDYEDLDEFGGNGFFTLGAQPGTGSAAPSYKDVVLGVDLIQVPTDLTISGEGGVPVVVPGYADPNHAVVRIGAIQVYSYPEINDGGYDFDGNQLN